MTDACTIGHFRFIRLADVDAAMRAGWAPTAALKDTPHGAYGVLCRWLCDCPEAWPISRIGKPS